MAGKVEKYARTIPTANREAVEQASLFAKGEMLRGIQHAGGSVGDKWQGWNRPGQGLSSGFNVKGYQRATSIVATRGPAHILFFGAAKHFIMASGLGTRATGRRVSAWGRGAFGGSNRGAFAASAAAVAASDAKRSAKGRSVKSRKRALRTPQGLRAYAFHPGMKGKNTWPATKQRIAAGSPVVWTRAHRRALAKSFSGR
jgi:hypothetical protein